MALKLKIVAELEPNYPIVITAILAALFDAMTDE